MEDLFMKKIKSDQEFDRITRKWRSRDRGCPNLRPPLPTRGRPPIYKKSREKPWRDRGGYRKTSEPLTPKYQPTRPPTLWHKEHQCKKARTPYTCELCEEGIPTGSYYWAGHFTYKIVIPKRQLNYYVRFHVTTITCGKCFYQKYKVLAHDMETPPRKEKSWKEAFELLKEIFKD